MSRRLKAALIAVLPTLITAAGLPAMAQEEAARDWYTVEVIVFRHWASADSEQFKQDAPPPAFQRLTVLRGDGRRPFRRLSGGELALQGARQRLEKSPDYEVLSHFGWEQPAMTEEAAISIALPLNWQPSPLTFDATRHPLGIPVLTPPEREETASDTGTAGGDTEETAASDSAEAEAAFGPSSPPSVFDELSRDTQLYGTLTLYRGRYLHMDADLRYRLRRFQASWTDRGMMSGPPVYVLDQRRRMRSGELHYLDHPAIGLLVKVTPVVASAPAEGNAAGADNAGAAAD